MKTKFQNIETSLLEKRLIRPLELIEGGVNAVKRGTVNLTEVLLR